MSISNYGITETIKNVFYIFKTKMTIPKARMVRTPIVIRGKRYIDFGQNLTTGSRCRIEVHGNHKDKRLLFGRNVNIGYDVRISCCDKIKIGNNVLMGSRVLIIDNSHGKYTGSMPDSPSTPPNKRELIAKPITIGDNVWIGENVVIQMGVSIGYASIIAANTVVTKDIPPMCIVAGLPAKVIKKYDENKKEWRKIE